MNILVIGYNAFDVTVPVSGLPALDGKHAVPAIMLGGGGPAATAAVCLARLGARVRLVTVLGDDEGAAVQRRELSAAGVDLSLCVEARGHAAPRAVILVDADLGTRTVLWFRGDLPPLTPATVEPRWLDDCDLLYCDGHEAHAAARLAASAQQRGLPVVLDAGSVRDGTAALVPRCSDVIGAEGFATAFTGEAGPLVALRALQDCGPRHVATTHGSAGVLALDPDDGSAFHVPAYAVAVRDTTGAGDVFHAGYAYARGRGDSWRACLDFGAATAALKCRDWGGRRGLPTLQEVEDLRVGGARRADRPPGGDA